MENNRPPLHPKLQIAVDRLNKRYSDITVKQFNTRECKVDGEMKEFIVGLRLFTSVWEEEPFAALRVTNTYDPYDNHRFEIESRLIKNERRPFDEKHTIKEKIIVKLVDQYARPFIYGERAIGILEKGHQFLRRTEYDAEQEKSSKWNHILRNKGTDIILDLIEGKINSVPTNLVKMASEFRRLDEHYNWIRSNRNVGEGSSMQVIAFQVQEAWVINIYGGGQATQVFNYDSFDSLPNEIKEKVALLRIAPHNEMLDEIGVKVEANSYFLYGKELQIYKKPNDSGEKSKTEGDKTT